MLLFAAEEVPMSFYFIHLDRGNNPKTENPYDQTQETLKFSYCGYVYLTDEKIRKLKDNRCETFRLEEHLQARWRPGLSLTSTDSSVAWQPLLCHVDPDAPGQRDKHKLHQLLQRDLREIVADKHLRLMAARASCSPASCPCT